MSRYNKLLDKLPQRDIQEIDEISDLIHEFATKQNKTNGALQQELLVELFQEFVNAWRSSP